MKSVVHFEMPYEDAKRVMEFYQKAFGWKMSDAGPDMGNYLIAGTTESDEKTGRPIKPGAINGGLYKRTKPEQVPSFVVSVEDINAAMEAVKQAGGKILGGMQDPNKPDDIPGVGLHVAFMDSEGNRVSMLQPKM